MYYNYQIAVFNFDRASSLDFPECNITCTVTVITYTLHKINVLCIYNFASYNFICSHWKSSNLSSTND